MTSGKWTLPFSTTRPVVSTFFASRLKYSRWIRVSVVQDQTVESLVRHLAEHLDSWGGAPLMCVFDRPKTVALKWRRNGEVTEWNPVFAYVMLELGIGVELCWPQQPNQKGAVENLVRSEEHTSELQSRLHLVCRLLLVKKNRFLFVLDQVPVTFSLGPSPPFHRSLRRCVFAQTERFGFERIYRRDLIIDFLLLVAVSELMIQTPKLVQHLDVAGIFFEQRPERENPDLRPARGYGRVFQNQICLPIVRLLFQNFFQHFNRALRIFFNFSLRIHNRERRS